MESRVNDGSSIDTQDALIKAKLEVFEGTCKRFEKAKSGAASRATQIKLLDEVNAKRREFYRALNDAIVDPESRTGEQFELWKRDRLASARNILNGLPEIQEKIREDRERLKLSKEKYEFEPAVFDNMQGIIAWELPEEAKLLREKFANANLPAGGFDNAIERNPFIKQHDVASTGSYRPSQLFDLGRLALIIYAVLILLCVAGGLFFKAGGIALLFLLVLLSAAVTFGSLIAGVWAIYKGASGATDIDVFGVKVKTKNVAVAFMSIAIVVGLFTTYAVLASPALGRV
ncbi:hypothetical protein [Roseimicrobium sp. ORNL1]|uniref:hypothetical protein n=1 Tax=Roseimicrobium sp. ORNL1 TaxID=2711231 RepID=UPI0013E12A2F|nr:hypothetical protein [Roseimicrobium sp. ORNL1]QIF03150.1 hypothetical protein G5S37_17010 [Roseimicrobium sp. ORNL1]